MAYNYYQTHKEQCKAKMKEYQQTHKEEHNQTCKKYRENNKQKVTESNKRWREANKEKFEENNRRFYQNNPDYNKNYYQAHKEELLAKQKQYREEHLGTKKEYNQQYYQNNKDKARLNAKQWREANKEKRKESASKYYQKKKQLALEKKMIEFNELAKKYQHNNIPQHEEYEAFENGSIWSWKQYKFKNQRKGTDGYYKVSLMIDKKKSYDFMVSRLVASAFDDRSIDEIEDLDVHHCNMKQLNYIDNLVYLPHQLHLQMHNKLTDQQIVSIGQQVKHLRGSVKTNKFVELVEAQIDK